MTFIRRIGDVISRIIAWCVTRVIYRVRISPSITIPIEGSGLIICNQKSYLDFLFIRMGTKRRVFFILNQPHSRNPLTHFFYWLANVHPLSIEDDEARVEALIGRARELLKDGHLVCIFYNTRLMLYRAGFPFRVLYERLTGTVQSTIIPVAIDQMWGGVFFYDKPGKRRHQPPIFPCPVIVQYGAPIPSYLPAYMVRTRLQELSAEAYTVRGTMAELLPDLFLREAKAHLFRHCMSDTTDMKSNYGHALAGIMMLRRRLFPEPAAAQERIGICLPDGCLAVVVTYAVLCAGHTVVPIPVPTTRDRLLSLTHDLGLRTIITTEAFVDQHDNGNYDAYCCIDRIIRSIPYRVKLWYRLLAFLLPRRAISRLFITRPEKHVHAIAAIIFSGGATGTPKAVQLTHLNISSNIEGLFQLLKIHDSDHILATVPFSHAFGFTVALCFPLSTGIAALYVPNPQATDEVVKRLKKYKKITLFLASSQVLALYARKCTSEDLAHLSYAIVGTDIIRRDTAELFYKKFGIHPFESYGATELSPLVTIGMPGFISEGEAIRRRNLQTFNVGFPLPGIAVKVINPETGEEAPYNEDGLLLVKGPNVMAGYVGDAVATEDVMTQQWYKTADIARIDENGFIHIVDRLSRFSTIGRHAISHKELEEYLNAHLSPEGKRCAVTTISDSRTEERLVVLYEPDVHIIKLWNKIKDDLLIIESKLAQDDFYEISAIPELPSGKINYVGLKEEARMLDFIHRSSKDFTEVMIESEDDIQLCLNHYRHGYGKVIIVAHGWRNAKDTYSFRLISGMFTKEYDVICFDFRGHGKSGGLFSWTAKEDADLKAVIEYAKRNEYKKIGVIGFSLGAMIAIIEGSKNKDIDSLVAVSPAYDFWKIDYHFWEEDIAHDLKIIFGPKGIGRTIRPGNPFTEKIRPIDVVDGIAPTPFLLIHGDADWLIKPYHSEILFEKAREPKKLIMLPGEGHADRIFDHNPKAFETVCLDWFRETL